MKAKINKSLFIEKAKEIWGDRYNYSLINEVKNGKDKVPIICPEHGVFYKDYSKFIIRQQGCPECAGKKRYTTEEFIKKAQKIHGNKYDFSKVTYINNKTKVTVICPEHGEFQITPLHLLSGEGCPKCRYIKSSAAIRRSVEEVIALAKKTHENKYDYSLIHEYKNDRIKYPIICPEHGTFYQTFNNHIKGKQGCPKCGLIKYSESRTMPFNIYQDIANKVHNNKYEYCEDSYVNSMSKIKIICPKHGEFWQNASNHIHLKHGCPLCSHSQSQYEDEIYEFICELIGKENVLKRCKNLLGNNKELDIYIPSKHIAIEFNGLYWHCEELKPHTYHLDKTNKCKELGIQLFHIFEDEWVYKQNIVRSMLKNLLGLTNNTIYARKCEIREVSSKNAKEFLDENHLQGNCVAKIRYGLFYNNELVSLMTFGKSRHFIGNNSGKIELLRFCNKINTNVIGGASKLFKYYINNNEFSEIISYADNRWSSGKLYEVLGFTLYNTSKPNYFYVIGNKREYRFNFRKNILMKKYNCPKDMSEKEFCKQHKWYRIYDCGCLCFKFKK